MSIHSINRVSKHTKRICLHFSTNRDTKKNQRLYKLNYSPISHKNTSKRSFQSKRPFFMSLKSYICRKYFRRYFMRRILFLLLLFVSILANAQSGRKKVAVVLSGGGAKGVAHISALKLIEDVGIPIDMIVGTSMGSIVGGLAAI